MTTAAYCRFTMFAGSPDPEVDRCSGTIRSSLKQSAGAALAILATALFLLGPAADAAADNAEAARLGYYDSVWPTGRSGAWRSGAATGAGLPADITSESLVTRTAELPTAPFWGVVYQGDTIFVLGGQPYLLDYFSFITASQSGPLPFSVVFGSALESAFVQPYIARLDAKTMKVLDIVELPQTSRPRKPSERSMRMAMSGDICDTPAPLIRPGEAAGASNSARVCSRDHQRFDRQLPTLNYFGNILIHENGRIYAVSTSRLFEVDPDSMKITRMRDLPRYETQSLATTYNGLAVAPLTGDIILKGFNFFNASAPAILLAVDTSTLSIRLRSDQDGIGATRLTTVAQDDLQFLYELSDTETRRYVITETDFELDSAWSQTYRSDTDGTTGAVSTNYMGDNNYVLFQNNNSVIVGVTAPLRIFSQETGPMPPPLLQAPANSSGLPGGNWYTIVTDPFNSQYFTANDSINGLLDGWRRENGELVNKWETGDYQSTAGAVIASDQGHFYVDDRRCDPEGENCKLFLVVLELATGKKIAEVEVAGSSPSLGGMFMSEDSVFFIATEPDKENGFVTRVSACPKGAAPDCRRRHH